MKTFLKSIVVPLAVLSGVVAVAAPIFSVQDVNLKIAALTAPFNTATTKMNFAFTSLNIDAVKTLDFGFKGLVSKIGGYNDATLEFKNAQYTYGDGTKPTVNVDVDLKLDLVKALGQKTINKFSGDLGQYATEYVQDYAEDYGPAAVVSAKTVEQKLDSKGDVERVKLAVSIYIDMTKLPATKAVEDVELQSVEIMVTAEKTGMNMTVQYVANPLYRRFQQDGDGLKEYVEKLLNNDQATYDEVSQTLAQFDAVAAWLVDLKPDP